MATDDEIGMLVAMQALYSAIGEHVATNDPSNLRGHVNDHYRRLYEETGATSFDVRAGGEKVGTYGFSRVRGRRETVDHVAEVTDMAALVEWSRGGQFDEWLHAMAAGCLHDMAARYFADTGELPDGMELVERVTPATPDVVRAGGTLRVGRDVVDRAREALAGGAIAGLLGGGE